MNTNPFKTFSKKEKILWVVSLLVVGISNIVSGYLSGTSGNGGFLNLIAALLGVTAVLLCAKGHVWGQILIAIFSLLYGVISFQFHYYGEMITYMGMCFPMAIWSLYTWIKHPSEQNEEEVKIDFLSMKVKLLLLLCGVVVTVVFYGILSFFNTPNLIFSTISITTSFFAAALTGLRSSYYAFWYALNDMVLIILWVLASVVYPGYVPLVVNFVVFLVNDSYGFYSWKKRENAQQQM